MKSIKIGDKVLVNTYSAHKSYIDTVERITKTMIILKKDNLRFNKILGWECGGGPYHPYITKIGGKI